MIPAKCLLIFTVFSIVSSLTPGEQDDIYQGVVAAFADDDLSLGMALAELAANPDHERMLFHIRNKKEAVKSYFQRTFAAQPDILPDADAAEKCEEPTPEADAMLNDFKNRFGSQLKRFENSGIVPAAVLNALQRSHSAILPAMYTMSVQFAKEGAKNFARAAAATAAAHTCAHMSDAALKLGAVGWAGFSKLGELVWRYEAKNSHALAVNTQWKANSAKWSTRIGVVLTVGQLGWQFYSQVRSYWKGDIDGYALAEDIMAGTASTLAGVGGGALGHSLCAAWGIWAQIGCSVVGGVVASAATDSTIRTMFQAFFGTDRDRALDTAYGVLGVSRPWSGRCPTDPQEVKNRYRSLAKQHHPDKGGDQQTFVKVNAAYELVRAACLAS